MAAVPQQSYRSRHAAIRGGKVLYRALRGVDERNPSVLHVMVDAMSKSPPAPGVPSSTGAVCTPRGAPSTQSGRQLPETSHALGRPAHTTTSRVWPPHKRWPSCNAVSREMPCCLFHLHLGRGTHSHGRARLLEEWLWAVRGWLGLGGGGGWHKASVSDYVPLAAPIGLSPLLILTLCGPERVLVVSTEPPDDLSCLTTPGGRPSWRRGGGGMIFSVLK